MRRIALVTLILAGCTTREADIGPIVGPESGCPAPQGELRCGYLCEWTPDDDAQMLFSQIRCKQIYGKKSCLRKLTKLGPRAYTAICRDKDGVSHIQEAPARGPVEPETSKEPRRIKE